MPLVLTDYFIREADNREDWRLMAELHDSFHDDSHGHVNGHTGFFSSKCDVRSLQEAHESDGLLLLAEKIIHDQRIVIGALLALDWQSWLQAQDAFRSSFQKARLQRDHGDVDGMYMRWVASRRSGVGTQLRQRLYTEACRRSAASIFCSIPEAPIKNDRSIAVHERDGWYRAGPFRHGNNAWGLYRRDLSLLED